MAYTNLPPIATLKPTKFEASASQQDLDEFKQLLKLSKLGPKTYENTTKDEGKYFGVQYDWMSQTKEYWQSKYDWRKAEAKINSFPNYKVDIKDDDGEVVNIHFIALYSDKKDAVPITLLHGWPGSFLEFLAILDIIKSKYPDPSQLPFHVIVPSLPGYGYSGGAPLTKDWKKEDIARMINKLMVGLGFGSGYVTQGGDIGSFVSRMLVVDYEECKAAHLNFCIMAEPSSASKEDISELEMKSLARLQDFQTQGNSYAREHGTRPATIGFALSSSPLALLAWIAEKFQTWTHHDPPLDEILDSVTLYWLTESFPRAIYPYRGLQRQIHDAPNWRIPESKGFGYSYFPYELGPVPVAWAATTGNLKWSRVHKEGGHFAAMEQPAALWGDIEEFVGVVWRGSGKEKL